MSSHNVHHTPQYIWQDNLILTDHAQEAIIIVCALIAILFGAFNVCKVLGVKVHSYGKGDIELQDTGETSDVAIEH